MDSGSARARRRWPRCRSTRCGYCSRRHGTGGWVSWLRTAWRGWAHPGRWTKVRLYLLRSYSLWLHVLWIYTHYGSILTMAILTMATRAMDLLGAAALSWLLEEMERELPTPPVQRSLLAELWRFLMHKHATLCRRLAPLPNAQCPMPNAQCPTPMLNPQCPMPNVQWKMPNAQ